MSQKVDINTVDKNFNIGSDEKEVRWINPVESQAVKVYGFNWFYEDYRYHRLPKYSDELVKTLEGSVDVLSNNSTGGIVAFKSNTKLLKVKVELSYMFHMGHMAYTGQAGFDVYRGKTFQELKFIKSTNFNFSNFSYEYTLIDTDLEQEEYLYVLNFPLYASVKSLEIGIDPSSKIDPVNDLFKNKGRIVFYGTSITQGGCASRPGLNFTQIISRRLERECLNYGFSGNGKGHIEIAEILSSIKDVELFVLDYQANVTYDRLTVTLDPFVKMIRSKYPNVPILIMSRVVASSEIHHLKSSDYTESSRDFQKAYVEENEKQDSNLYYLDGSQLLGFDDHECTVDGIHPNDLGFMKMADVLTPIIDDILNNKYRKN